MSKLSEEQKKAVNPTAVNPTKVVTDICRLSYANIWQPRSVNGSTPKYSTTVLIPKSDTVTMEKIKSAY